MSNELAIRPHAGGLAQLDRMYAWADVAQRVAVMAESLAKTSFVPAPMRGKPAEVTACILAGQEVNLQPMAALRAIDLIDGKPVINAMGMRAIVLAEGHRIWVEESTATRAVVCGVRKGEEKVQTSEWTIERAQRAGLTSKTNWQRHPSAMLAARATAEVCRLIAADALLAMPYSAEEIRDEQEPTTSPDLPGTDGAPTRTFRRAPLDRHAEDNGSGDLGDAVQAELHPDVELHDRIAVTEEDFPGASA